MRSRISSLIAAAAVAALPGGIVAQGATHPTLHVNTRWTECSLQLDPSLTQSAWRQFTGEAGVVVAFRPLADARPMGRGKFEVSLLQWKTGIDNADAAWNDTFVHPDSTHWLFEGNGLKFPGVTVRAGLTDKTDAGIYFTKSPGANYGFVGGQVQHSLGGILPQNWAASVRASIVRLYGPDDVHFAVYDADVLASRTFAVVKHVTISPYAGLTASLSRGHETSAVVNLRDENVLGAQGAIGAVAQVGMARVGVEYGVSRVNSFSLKVGFGRN